MLPEDRRESGERRAGLSPIMNRDSSYVIGQWLTPSIVTGVTAAIIAAVITAFVTLWAVRKQLLQQRQLDEARHKQSVQAFVDYLYDVRTLNRPPQPSGDKLWGIAEKRLREVRRRLTETLRYIAGRTRC